MSEMEKLCAETDKVKVEAAKLASVVHKTAKVEDWRTVLKRNLLTLIAVALYISLGMLCYSYLERDQETGEQWTPVEALYFSVTTISTVGYGDYAPSTDESRVFTAFYMTLGVAVVFWLMGPLYHYFIEVPVYAVCRAVGRCWKVSAPACVLFIQLLCMQHFQSMGWGWGEHTYTGIAANVHISLRHRSPALNVTRCLLCVDLSLTMNATR
jgi:hypothetical protein